MNNTQMNIDKTQNTSSFSTADTKKKRRKIRIKPTKDGMLALLALVLITALVVTALAFACKGIVTAIKNAQSTEDTTDPNNGQNTLPWNNAYITVPKYASDIHSGDLILVNNDNPYSVKLGSTNLSVLSNYQGSGTYFLAIDGTTKISSPTIQSLQQMIVALVDDNPDTLGTTSDKHQIFIPEAYLALSENTGTSEHHTGLALNLKVLKPGELGKRENIALREEELSWLKEHSMEYGFVIRYDQMKASVTGVEDEPNHLRYVGIPHATYMMQNNRCLEEYLDLLRTSHSYEQTPLEITANEKEYLVYYVPANTTEGATFTSIPVPPASEGTYSISGDNMNGFIVTVEKTAK